MAKPTMPPMPMRGKGMPKGKMPMMPKAKAPKARPPRKGKRGQAIEDTYGNVPL